MDMSSIQLIPPDGRRLAVRDPLTVVGDICGRLNAAHADLIELVQALVRDESWAVCGIGTPEHWLTCFAGVSSSVAKDLVQVATRRGELPAMAREIDSGRLSLGQAAVVARHTPIGYDEDVVELAVHATVPQLRRALVKYEFPVAPSPIANDLNGTDEAAEPPDAPVPPDALSVAALPPQLSMRWDQERFHLEYSAPADIGALVERALVEAKDALFLATQGTGPDDPAGQGRRVGLADAMEQMAVRSLDAGTTAVAGRAGKFRVYLHLDSSGHGWLQKRGALPPHLMRKWTCDGLVQPVWETQGSPVNVGRAQRIVPARTRRLVEDRDRGCRFPGCMTIHHVECHHVVHWADGGDTDLDGLISLCPHHHDRHHAGDFQIAPVVDQPGRFLFLTRGGFPLEPVTTPAVHESVAGGGPGDATVTAMPRRSPNGSPPRYVGPTNEVLQRKWITFHRNRPGPADSESPNGEDPSDEK